MILREWRARTDKTRAGQYPAHFRHDVEPSLRRIEGFLGADVCARETGGTIEYVVLTRWRSRDAVRAFAGADYEKSVVDADAARMLTDFDAHVRHYDIIPDASLP